MSQESDLWSHDEYAAEEKARATRAKDQTFGPIWAEGLKTFHSPKRRKESC